MADRVNLLNCAYRLIFYTTCPNPQEILAKIANKFMMVASVNTNLQSERSHLSRNESESCKVSAFHG